MCRPCRGLVLVGGARPTANPSALRASAVATLCPAYGAGFACNFLPRREGLPLKAKVRHPPRLRRFLKFNGATARDRLHTQECLCHIEADETGRPRPEETG